MTNEHSPKSLGEALPQEMARVRDELLPAYQSIGPAGAIGAAMLRSALDRATRALAEGDLVAMIQSYEELRGCE